MTLTIPLVLASQSPRRRRLLEQLGWTFRVQPSAIDEVIPDDARPSNIVQQLAHQKAEAVVPYAPDALILAADTVVVLDGEILGKPTSEDDAVAILHRLSGQVHEVLTGLALVHPASERHVTAVESTQVHMMPLQDAEITAYVASGSPMDKAGAYGIQDDYGALFVERIEGDYYNVVGLPLHRLYATLRHEFKELVRWNL